MRWQARQSSERSRFLALHSSTTSLPMISCSSPDDRNVSVPPRVACFFFFCLFLLFFFSFFFSLFLLSLFFRFRADDDGIKRMAEPKAPLFNFFFFFFLASGETRDRHKFDAAGRSIAAPSSAARRRQLAATYEIELTRPRSTRIDGRRLFLPFFFLAGPPLLLHHHHHHRSIKVEINRW